VSYLAQQLAAKSVRRADDYEEPPLWLPLSDELAELLRSRVRAPLSRVETAALRRCLFAALDVAVGKGHKS
jgi:hypothetical protein